MKLIKNMQFVALILTIAFSTFGQTPPREAPLPSTAPGGPGWVVYGQENLKNKYPNAQVPSDVSSTKKSDPNPPMLPTAEERRKKEILRKEMEIERKEFLKDLED